MNAVEPNIADLLKQLRDDITTLVRQEIALAKAEMSEKVSRLSHHAVLLVAGSLLGYASLVLLLIGLGFWLRDLFLSMGWADGVSTFCGLLIVSGITGAVGAATLLRAWEALKQETLLPRRTIRSLNDDKQMIQNKLP